MSINFTKDIQYYKFCMYGFFKNLKFFEPFLILFFLEKGLSFWQIGLIYSVREITRNIFEIPSGVIADAFGRRRTLIISFIIYSVSFIVFYFSNSYYVILIAMLVFALGDAFRTGTNKSMIFGYIESKGWADQKIYYYGHTRSWSQRGSAVSSLIAAAIVFYFQNYTVIFLVSIIPYILNALIIYSYPKFLEGETQKLHKKDFFAAFKNTHSNIRDNLKKAKYWKTVILHSVHSGYHKAIKEYIQPIIVVFVLGAPFLLELSNKRREAIFIGIIYFVIFLLTAQASKKSGRFSEKIKSPINALIYTLILGLFAGIIAGVGIILGYEYIGIVMFIIIYLVENLRKPIGVAAVADQSNKSVMTTSLSINSQTESFFAAIIAPILGLVVDAMGLGEGLLIISAGILLLSLLFLFIFRFNEQQY